MSLFAAALNVAIHVLYRVVGDDWPEQEMERKIISLSSGGCIGVCVRMNAKLFLVFLNENFGAVLNFVARALPVLQRSATACKSHPNVSAVKAVLCKSR